MTTHMYIHARLQLRSHFDFPLFSGQIYGVDHGRGNDFDDADSDTLGVGASCHWRGRPVRLVWPKPVLEYSKGGTLKVGVTTTTGARVIVSNPSCRTLRVKPSRTKPSRVEPSRFQATLRGA